MAVVSTAALLVKIWAEAQKSKFRRKYENEKTISQIQDSAFVDRTVIRYCSHCCSICWYFGKVRQIDFRVKCKNEKTMQQIQKSATTNKTVLKKHIQWYKFSLHCGSSCWDFGRVRENPTSRKIQKQKMMHQIQKCATADQTVSKSHVPWCKYCLHCCSTSWDFGRVLKNRISRKMQKRKDDATNS